jgi:ribosomal-protein-alanine N-acetyltransferase
MKEFPVLKTERLVLREFQPSDAHWVYDIFSKDIVTRYHNLETMRSMKQVEVLVKIRASVFEDGLGIRWGITLKEASDKGIGSVGFYNLDDISHRAEIGYDLHPGFWRQGIMTEALTAVIDYRYSHLFPFSVNRIQALTYLDSQASGGLLFKLGFQEEGVARAFGYWKGAYHDLRTFSLLHRDWVG